MVSEVSLGMPKVKDTPFPRKKTRLIHVGDVPVGGGSPISVQSMTTTKTYDIGATLQQIAELTFIAAKGQRIFVAAAGEFSGIA